MTDQKRPAPKPPIVIELDDSEEIMTPDLAPPVPEMAAPVGTPAVETAARVAAYRPSAVTRVFFWAFLTLVGFVVSVGLWDFAAGMVDRNLWLGRIALGLLAAFLVSLFLIGCRELLALFRLRRIDSLRQLSESAADGSVDRAHVFVGKLEGLYAGRPELRWGIDETRARSGDLVDPVDVLHLAEVNLMTPLDQAATKEIETAARQVATATALVPLAFADVIVALTANLRMIRRIAQIYGGRAGFLGSWRLTRAVATHLIATGAVAVGDDLIGSLAGGGVLSKLSRRFGEGLINGALTARVGVAAMEVCRPMAFQACEKPKVTGLVKRALTGLFS